MHTWSKMRQKLEQVYLAPALRGRLTYFVTTYHKTHDRDEGRVALRLDGAEILKSNYFDRFGFGLWSSYEKRQASGDSDAWRNAQYDVIESGEFYQADFYRAFGEFDSQPIAESLCAQNALVRMFALLDRRTGKRTLEKLRTQMQKEPQWLQMIYCIRLEAEGMPLPAERKPMKQAILFDLDGTLWDSSAEVVKSWNHTIQTKTDRSEQFTVDDMHRYMGKTLEAIAEMMFPSLPAAERESILRRCNDDELVYLSEKSPTKPPLYPDEEAVIRRLQEQYILGIVSNCQVGYIEIYLHQQPFADAFCDHECAGKTGLSKGQNIRLVMERQGITDCIYVGDTQGDADAAKEAGVKFIHAAYGFGTVDACDAAIDDFRKLPETAARLFAGDK